MTESATQPSGQSPAAGNIDIQRLADKVYELMRAEARLGRARNDSPPASQRKVEA